MKMKKNLLASSVAASAIFAAAMAPVAQADVDVSAAVGAANMYYWRGQDLGNGDAAVWGELMVSSGGFYGGMWTSSGDSGSGVEYDLFVGYGGAIGDFTYDLSIWNYVYPSSGGDFSSPGDLVEAAVGLGYGPLSVTYYDNIEGDTDYWYTSVGLEAGSFEFLYGLHEDDYAHFDISYAYNDNVSFTLGLVVDDVDGEFSDEAKFVVGFSIPIE